MLELFKLNFQQSGIIREGAAAINIYIYGFKICERCD